MPILPVPFVEPTTAPVLIRPIAPVPAKPVSVIAISSCSSASPILPVAFTPETTAPVLNVPIAPLPATPVTGSFKDIPTKPTLPKVLMPTDC